MNKLFATFNEIPLFAVLPGSVDPHTIPACIFHKVDAGEFDDVLSYLRTNQYRTLGIDEFYDYLTGARSDADKKIILTFDDGVRNNWSIVYPLLKKYGMKAVLYVNPAAMGQGGVKHNLEDVWAGKITMGELDAVERDFPYISWDEARAMEASGLITIESHGWGHQMCFTGDTIVDFQRPDLKGMPRYRWLHTAVDADPDAPLWGAPVYPLGSRFVAMRFFDDTGLREACMRHVEQGGGEAFFQRKDACRQLRRVVLEYKRSHVLHIRYEDWIDQEMAIKHMITSASEAIEREMQKKSVHFAYPWSVGGRLSDLWLKELGFKTVFHYMNSRQFNRIGDGTRGLKRFEGYWIPGLPGSGRISVWKKISQRSVTENIRHLLDKIEYVT